MNQQKEREDTCNTCGRQITVSSDGLKEYGHERDCPERPTEFKNRVGGRGYFAEQKRERLQEGEL